MKSCPCGLPKTYQECCGIYIENAAIPITPEQLMRSRYTAYTQANTDYIANTMREKAAEHFDLEATRAWAQSVNWLGLTIVNAEPTQPKATLGFVEFIARFKQNDKVCFIYEKSEFKYIDNRWYYTSGRTPDIERNNLCPCGSGKKYKKCCTNNF